MKFVLLVIIAVCFWCMVADGFDQTIKRQDMMLCNSANVSGNTEYLAKCQCYYGGDDISCIEKAEILKAKK